MRLTVPVVLLAFVLAGAAGAQQPKRPAGSPAAKPPAQRTPAPKAPPVNFGPVEGLTASPLTQVVTIRSKPGAQAPVVATLGTNEYGEIAVLGADRDALHVKYKGQEGWTTWSEMVADGSAIVVDTASGSVASRVPLPLGTDGVVFSPDGSRAFFYNHSYAGANTRAYEVRTSDWTLTRSIAAPQSDTEQVFISTLFYGPSDGALRAAVYSTSDAGNSLRVVRVGDEGAPAGPVEWSAAASGFVVSPDKHLGFVVRDTPPNAPEGSPTLVDVIDLSTLKTRNTLRLTGSPTLSDASQIILNDSGSELYLTTDTSIVVLDTATGKQLRTLNPGFAAGESPSITQGGVLGDTLLVSTYGSESTSAHAVWLSGGKPTPAAAEISHVARAGATVYALDDVGELLYTLDADHRVASKVRLERPDVHPGWRAQWQPEGIAGLAASPDGKFVLVFVSTPQGD